MPILNDLDLARAKKSINLENILYCQEEFDLAMDGIAHCLDVYGVSEMVLARIVPYLAVGCATKLAEMPDNGIVNKEAKLLSLICMDIVRLAKQNGYDLKEMLRKELDEKQD